MTAFAAAWGKIPGASDICMITPDKAMATKGSAQLIIREKLSETGELLYRTPHDPAAVVVVHHAKKGQSDAPRCSAAEAHQVGTDCGLVDKYQPGGIKQALLPNPTSAPAQATSARCRS